MAKYRIVIDVDTRKNTSVITAIDTTSAKQMQIGDFVYLCNSAILEFAVAMHGLDFCDGCIIEPYEQALDDALEEYDRIVEEMIEEEQENIGIEDTAKVSDDFMKSIEDLGVKSSLSVPDKPVPHTHPHPEKPKRTRKPIVSKDDMKNNPPKEEDNTQNTVA